MELITAFIFICFICFGLFLSLFVVIAIFIILSRNDNYIEYFIETYGKSIAIFTLLISLLFTIIIINKVDYKKNKKSDLKEKVDKIIEKRENDTLLINNDTITFTFKTYGK